MALAYDFSGLRSPGLQCRGHGGLAKMAEAWGEPPALNAVYFYISWPSFSRTMQNPGDAQRSRSHGDYPIVSA